MINLVYHPDYGQEVLTLPSTHYRACCSYFSFKKSSKDYQNYLKIFNLCKFLAESSVVLRAHGDEVLAIDENEL